MHKGIIIMKSIIQWFVLFGLFVDGFGTDYFENCPPNANGTNPVLPFLVVVPQTGEGCGDKQLICQAPYPIQIVFDTSEQSELCYSWYTVSYSDFLNPSTYKFTANKVVTFKPHRKVETIVCVSVDFPCLQHRLHVSNTSADGSALRFKTEESTTKGISLPDSQPVVVKRTEKCDASFYYEESGSSSYLFRCKFANGTAGAIKQLACANSLSCIHILRRHSLQTGCWSRYNSSSSSLCEGCQATIGLPNFLSSVTVCTKDEQDSGIGTIVFYGVASQENPRPKIAFSMDDLKEGKSESAPFINIVEFKTVQDLNSSLELECRASSFATAASMQWALEFKGNNNSQFQYLAVEGEVKWIEVGTFRSNKRLLRLNDTKLIKIHCYASIENTYKWLHASRSIQVQVQAQVDVKTKAADSVVRIDTIITISVVIPLLIIILIVVGVLFWRIKKLKNALRNLTEEEIRDFKYGNGLLDPKDVHAPIHGRPFNTALEIPRDRLELDEKCILGSGQYGIVMKGYLLEQSQVESSTGKELVAIKTVKPDVDVETFKALLSEIKIMGYLDKHENIVGLLGACTQNIKEREVWAAIEFCQNGDLLGYLKKHRATFKNLFETLQPNENPTTYINLTSSSGEYENRTFTTLDLLKFAEGITNGMNYLTIKKVIHADLAARNVLITDTMRVKISDFGLSRQLVQYSNYVKTQQVPLPFRWLAIESLKDMEFSIKSDVWAFGVVLWELFSLGETPYPGYSWTHEFLDQLNSGYRMKRPDFANDVIYDIMLDCWRITPESRPSFDTIHSQISQIIADLTIKTNNNAKC